VLEVAAHERRAYFRLWASFPRLVFSMVLLATPLRTLHTPLLEQLLASGRTMPMGYGFLTLDLGRRVVCLHSEDSLARRVPLVGVWVDLAGLPRRSDERLVAAHWDALEVVDNPLVWAAAARYVHSSRAGERVWVEDNTFLLFVVHHVAADGSPDNAEVCPSFFEAKYDDSGGEALLAAPADAAACFNVDASHSNDIFEPFTVRRLLMSEAEFLEEASHNPEEVPLCSNAPWLQPLQASTEKLVANFEQPRSIPPRPYPTPVQNSLVQGYPRSPVQSSRKFPAAIASPGDRNSPERVASLSSRDAQQTSDASRLPTHMELASKLQGVTTGKYRDCNEHDRTSENGKEPPARVSLASWTLPSPVDSCTAASGFFRNAQHENKIQPAEDDSLRQLVTMQQRQMLELQRQISDLTSMVAGMANRSTAHEHRPSKESLGASPKLIPRYHHGRPKEVCSHDLECLDSDSVARSSFTVIRGESASVQNSRHGQAFQDSFAVAGVQEVAKQDHQSVERLRSGTVKQQCDARVGESVELPQGAFTSRQLRDARVGDSMELPRGAFAAPNECCDASVNTNPTPEGENILHGMQTCRYSEKNAPLASRPDGEASAQNLASASPLTSIQSASAISQALPSVPRPTPAAQHAHLSPHVAAEEPEELPDLELHVCTDSADTAGGGMPRRTLHSDVAPTKVSPIGMLDAASMGLTCSETVLREVPRIIWSPSASSVVSSIEDEDVVSDAGSLDSSPVLGLALGLGRHRVVLKTNVL
jgi:hypothetical protein